jgi:hypothetical protein
VTPSTFVPANRSPVLLARIIFFDGFAMR